MCIVFSVYDIWWTFNFLLIKRCFILSLCVLSPMFLEINIFKIYLCNFDNSCLNPIKMDIICVKCFTVSVSLEKRNTLFYVYFMLFFLFKKKLKYFFLTFTNETKYNIVSKNPIFSYFRKHFSTKKKCTVFW